MSMIGEEYVITCDKCYREWDGNAQCPCGIDNSSEDEIFDDDEISDFKFPENNDLILSPISTRCNSPTPSDNFNFKPIKSFRVKNDTIKNLFYTWKKNTIFSNK